MTTLPITHRSLLAALTTLTISAGACASDPPPVPEVGPREVEPEWLEEARCVEPRVSYSQRTEKIRESQPGVFRANISYPVLYTPWDRDISTLVNRQITDWINAARQRFLRRIQGGSWDFQADCLLTAPNQECTSYFSVVCKELHISAGMGQPIGALSSFTFELREKDVAVVSLGHLCNDPLSCGARIVELARNYSHPQLEIVPRGKSVDRGSRFVLSAEHVEFKEFLLTPRGLQLEVANYLPPHARQLSSIQIPAQALSGILKSTVTAHWETTHKETGHDDENAPAR